jgi:hypothetical protein
MESGQQHAPRARVVVTTAVRVLGLPAAGAGAWQALADLDRAIDAFSDAEREYDSDDPGAYNRAALTVHLLNLAMFECERAGVPDDDLRRRLSDVRRSYARSAFVRRLQTWPRGYPGDWERSTICSTG